MISTLTARPFTRLLVPLDGSWRAEYALPLIKRLACAHQLQVHVVHVVKKPEMARRLPPTQEDINLSNRLVARNQEEATHYLDQVPLCSPLAGIDVETHLLIRDDVTAALHEFVERERIDMVALTAHGYSGNTQWRYGSMANNFILYSHVPLLVIQDIPATESLTVTEVAVKIPRPGPIPGFLTPAATYRQRRGAGAD
jgi:nucleotide-binding universal stress UspA family protein